MRGKGQWLKNLRADLTAALTHRQQLREISRRHFRQHLWIIRTFNRRTFGNLENAKRLLDAKNIEWREQPGLLFLRTGDVLIVRDDQIIGYRQQTPEEMFSAWRK